MKKNNLQKLTILIGPNSNGKNELLLSLYKTVSKTSYLFTSTGLYGITKDKELYKEHKLHQLERELKSISIAGTKFDIDKKTPFKIKELMELIHNIKNDCDRYTHIFVSEIENNIDPKWLKIFCGALKEIFKNTKIKIMITTNNPEVLYLFNNEIESIATPIKNGKKLHYINFMQGVSIYEKISRKNIKIDEYIGMCKAKMSWQLARLLFSKREEVIICEGITDQLLFKRFTPQVVINSFGWFNLSIFLSLYYALYDNFGKIKIITDSDIFVPNTEQLKIRIPDKIFKKRFYHFNQYLELDLYGKDVEQECKTRGLYWNGRITEMKFRLLQESYSNSEFTSKPNFKKLLKFLNKRIRKL